MCTPDRAVRNARGDSLLFIDGNETPAPDWLRGCGAPVSTRLPNAFDGLSELIFEGGRPAVRRRPHWLPRVAAPRRYDGAAHASEHPVRWWPLRVPQEHLRGDRWVRRRVRAQAQGAHRGRGCRPLPRPARLRPQRVVDTGCVGVPPDPGRQAESQPVSRLPLPPWARRRPRRRGSASRIRPACVLQQAGRALTAFVRQWRADGRYTIGHSEMNVAYFAGCTHGRFLGSQPVRSMRARQARDHMCGRPSVRSTAWRNGARVISHAASIDAGRTSIGRGHQ